ncbi:MAG TPA: signal peptide peptidase SppA [Azospirillaceae bacterium]|nr:signal peptide peptidase SppA [Azospirillaceae bacterium]
MVRLFVRIFAVIGLMAVLLVAGAIFLAMQFGPKPKALPGAIVLELDLEKPMAEAPSNDPFAGFGSRRQPTVRDVVEALDRASADPRVKGLVAHFGNNSQGMAATQELRAAVERFRRSGRFALAHAETFGEFQSGMQSYYLASAFEQVWMQPLGNLGITGVMIEAPFFRGTLDKLEMVPQIGKRQEYKSAAEPFMETQASSANREMTESLLNDLFGQMVEGVAAARSLTPDQVRQAVDRAPLLDREAVDSKLVDRLGYRDEIEAEARGRAGDGKLVPLSDYAGGTQAAAPGTRVALVTGSGAIQRGTGGAGPFGGGSDFASDDTVEAFDRAIGDPQVKAILFRVNSPGGSAVASEAVRRAVRRARAAGKPVVVSMGDLAASGGYWVAMDADRIVAHPATLTGSIGVLGGKIVTTGLTDKLGIGFTLQQRGANAGIWTDKRAYAPGELQRRDAMLDDIYAGFTAGVAEGRKLDRAVVDRIARGRVWTGRQAKENGLVDVLGGYPEALAEIRTLLKLAPDAALDLVPYPAPKTQLELVMDVLQGDGQVRLGAWLARDALADTVAEYRPLLAKLQPLLAAARQEEMVLLMPPTGIGGY